MWNPGPDQRKTRAHSLFWPKLVRGKGPPGSFPLLPFLAGPGPPKRDHSCTGCEAGPQKAATPSGPPYPFGLLQESPLNSRLSYPGGRCGFLQWTQPPWLQLALWAKPTWAQKARRRPRDHRWPQGVWPRKNKGLIRPWFVGNPYGVTLQGLWLLRSYPQAPQTVKPPKRDPACPQPNGKRRL